MSTEARCEKCNKLLGKMEGLEALATLVRACQSSKGKLVFSVQCPRCGKLNNITVEY